MKVATILPQTHLNHVQYDTYHMCLANLIGEPGMENIPTFIENRLIVLIDMLSWIMA